MDFLFPFLYGIDEQLAWELAGEIALPTVLKMIPTVGSAFAKQQRDRSG
jgi:hypothetical protein